LCKLKKELYIGVQDEGYTLDGEKKMTVQQNVIDNELRANSVETYFLFGFLFSRLEFGVSKPKPNSGYHRDEIEYAIRKSLSNDVYFGKRLNKESISFCNDTSSNRESTIQYYVLLDNPYLYLRFKTIEVEICEEGVPTQKKKNQARITHWSKAQLWRYIRLYESGMGMYGICVQPIGNKNCELGASEIISLDDLGSPISEITEPEQVEELGKHLFSFRHRGNEVKLFNLYSKDISEFKRVLSNRIPSELKGPKDGLVRSLYSNLSWIELKDSVAVPPHTTNARDNFQNPYVLNRIQLDEKQFSQLPSNIRDTKKPQNSSSESIENDLESILLRRVEPGETSRDYVIKFCQSIEGYLANMCVSSRAFVNIHIRSMMYLWSSDKKSKSVDRMLFPTLLDTIELIRMRWYTYVITNRLLDVHVKELWEEFYSLTRQGRLTSRSALAKCQESIIETKSEITKVLEVPISYRRASGTATTIYDTAEDLFQIKELQCVLKQKSECLHDLFRSIDELRRRLDYERPDTKSRRRLRLKKIMKGK
jgi:hypothetical protein